LTFCCCYGGSGRELAGLADQTLKKILRFEKNAARFQQRLIFFPVFYAIASCA
jgi:hypothetical protein